MHSNGLNAVRRHVARLPREAIRARREFQRKTPVAPGRGGVSRDPARSGNLNPGERLTGRGIGYASGKKSEGKRNKGAGEAAVSFWHIWYTSTS